MSIIKKKNKFKIAFCITCMNRLSHIKETLIKNIEDNYIPNQVQFILLDYNSNDGLDEWVKTLNKYIENDILVYYRTREPQYYHRSHSRNMSFRLAKADVVCNLDADNYLGKGFADYIINRFSEEISEKVFITSNCNVRDVYGRFSVNKTDFIKMKGYNESLSGYGVEDIELFYRFIKSGFRQLCFSDPSFYHVIHHSHTDRISQELRFKQMKDIFISHPSPISVSFFIFYNNNVCEFGTLINNKLRYSNIRDAFSNPVEFGFDERVRIVLTNPLMKGKWIDNSGQIDIRINNSVVSYKNGSSSIEFNGTVFYKITEDNIISELMMYLSDAINYNIAKEQNNDTNLINPDGFGKGVVYKNFNYTKPINLN